MVFAPTHGIYNRIDNYTGTAERLGLEELRRQYALLVKRLDTPEHKPRALSPLVRLLHCDVARVPFRLQFLSMDQFWTLFDLDEQMMKARGESGKGVLRPKDLPELIQQKSTDPIRLNAMALLSGFTDPQKGEYLALVDVAKGLIDPHEMAAHTKDKSRSPYAVSYLLEKLGNGYLRRVLEKFGVEPVGAAVALQPQPKNDFTDEDDF